MVQYQYNAAPKHSLMQMTLVDGCEIVQRMLELLSQEIDPTCHEWAAVIVEDLVEHAKQLFRSEASKELLLYAIQIPADLDPVPARLQVRPLGMLPSRNH